MPCALTRISRKSIRPRVQPAPKWLLRRSGDATAYNAGLFSPTPRSDRHAGACDLDEWFRFFTLRWKSIHKLKFHIFSKKKSIESTGELFVYSCGIQIFDTCQASNDNLVLLSFCAKYSMTRIVEVARMLTSMLIFTLRWFSSLFARNKD